jgi:transposase
VIHTLDVDTQAAGPDGQDRRKTKRYPSDLTDEEWYRIAPLMPKPGRRGRPREVEFREVINAKGFEVLPRRWVVERTFGWMIRWRRLVRDYERRIDV